MVEETALLYVGKCFEEALVVTSSELACRSLTTHGGWGWVECALKYKAASLLRVWSHQEKLCLMRTSLWLNL